MVLFAAALAILAPGAAPSPYFKITVVDEQTGRGVPLVELRTVDQVVHVTDSGGVVAFREPGLMGQKVYFHVKGHGYEYPKDRSGYRGQALDVIEGGSAVLKVKRVNIAERLYRVTGEGIYRDTLLLGETPPIRAPALNARVVGSDSVASAVFGGKVHWFWGDTNRPDSPLGNFHVPGATSERPGEGGLDPEVGVDLKYYLNGQGFAKETARMPGQGPTWISGLTVLRDRAGGERMFAIYAKVVHNTLEVYERGLVEWDSRAEQFIHVSTFPREAPIYPDGHTFLRTERGVEYVYFANPYPLTRVRAEPELLADVSQYETYTPLKPEGRPNRWTLDRDAQGRVNYAWKVNTLLVGHREQQQMVREHRSLRSDEALLQLRDATTGVQVIAHGGSVYWNNFLRRWVMIAVEWMGDSTLGEVWFAEADTPVGPWVYARKVATHDRYSFYNPTQHPYFDKDGGRVIFFEGTYAAAFSGNDEATPRYDYNQLMYKLDLADPRLNLPVAVYRHTAPGVPDWYGTLRRDGPGRDVRSVAFFALEHPAAEAVPIYEVATGGVPALSVAPPPPTAAGRPAPPVFYALPAEAGALPPATAPLYEYLSDDGTRRLYSTDPALAGFRRVPRPVCNVWRNPMQVKLPL
jgi:hypothetical protein